MTESTAQARTHFIERIGMHPELAIGYLGLLLFMIGDGVEAGFLSPLLVDLHFSAAKVALVFTAYGVTAALASWLSGALSDIFGPKKVMWAGLLIWLGFEIPFLVLGIAHANYAVIVLSYGLRGFGYPLFAYGFLVWVAAVTPERYLATAIGWFWSARTGGLPTLGALLASFSVPLLGTYKTLWVSVVLVAIGGLIMLFGVNESHGSTPLSTTGENPLKVLLTGVSIVWRHPKVGLGGIVATITTTSEFGFLVFLPIFFIHVIGFTLEQWLQILSIMFATNVVANLFWNYYLRRLLRLRRYHAGPVLRAPYLRHQLPVGGGCGHGLRHCACRLCSHRRHHGRAGTGVKGCRHVDHEPRLRHEHLDRPCYRRRLPAPSGRLRRHLDIRFHVPGRRRHQLHPAPARNPLPALIPPTDQTHLKGSLSKKPCPKPCKPSETRS
jgi:MFS family permease